MSKPFKSESNHRGIKRERSVSAKNSVQKQEILLIIDSYHLKYETQTDDSIDTCEDETEIFEGRRGFSRTEMKKS